MFENAYNQYMLYLNTEGMYTQENLNIISSFSDFINLYYGSSEVILFDTCPMDGQEALRFLGIDIIDEHLKSVLRNGKRLQNKEHSTNQYALYCNINDAEAFVQSMRAKSKKYADISCVYVYRYQPQM